MPVQNLEEKIISQCKKNNREGYNTLFQKYEGYIYTICYRYTNSKEDALDLVQEVFLRIYNGMAGFKEGRPILPWIKRITINTCLNYLRVTKLSTVSLEQPLNEDEFLVENRIADSGNIEDTVILSQTKDVLELAIATLPPEMKMAVILRHLEGMSYAEISEAMSVPIGTIKTYLYRGKCILKTKLRKCGVWEV